MKKVHNPRLIDTGSFSMMSSDHRLVLKETGAQVKARELAQHLQEALVRGFVEAVERLDLLEPLGVHALRPAVDGADPRRPRPCAALASARYCSTGPPGTNWITTKVSSSTPNSVGIISSRRLKM